MVSIPALLRSATLMRYLPHLSVTSPKYAVIPGYFVVRLSPGRAS